MTTSTRKPMLVTCVGIVINNRVVPVTDQNPVIIEDGSVDETNEETRELIPVMDTGTLHTLAVATLKATINTLLDELGEMEQ